MSATATRQPNVDALDGLDLSFAPADVPEMIRSTGSVNPFLAVVGGLADDLKAWIAANPGKDVRKDRPREGNARVVIIPGKNDTGANLALKQASRKLTLAGSAFGVSVMKKTEQIGTGKDVNTRITFHVGPKITRTAAANGSGTPAATA